ncbi:CHASE domain-containing protein [Phycisphaerales bacterium AB-hyl4]|uniref:CHASE domain-containing protein n=1 Tax=Natronomicrosphaera hydrolytica TaxID=3242702 RepID=A0ABV4UB72_9BACT
MFKRHVPLLVGLLSITATLAATVQLDTTIRQRDELRVDAWVEKTHDNAHERIYNHANMLRGLRGLFISSEHVSVIEFDRFVDSMGLAERYPAVLGVGFAIEVSPDDLDQALKLLRKRNPSLDIWPARSPADLTGTTHPTIYYRSVRPDGDDLTGFDIGATSVGRAAMRRSQTTFDTATLGDRLEIPRTRPLATATDSPLPNPDSRQFALYLPVFHDDLFAGRETGDESEVIGYLYMVIDTDIYWDNIFHPLSKRYFDIYVYNGLLLNPASLEFTNGSPVPPRSGAAAPRYERTATVELAGRPWTLLFQSKPGFEALSTRTIVVPTTFGAGLLASLVLFVLARSQTLAWVTAREANEELQRSEQRLRNMNETLEQRVADRTAIAERRAAQVRRLAAEVTHIEQRERRRLARTLHDHLQQLLVAARMRLQIMHSASNDDELQTTSTELDQLLQDAIQASRSLTIELSPPILHESGLVTCLEWLARHIRQQHHLHVAIEVDGDAETIDALVSCNVKIMLFESTREALLNVVKYAGVSEAQLQLRHDPTAQTLELTIADEGVGFEADKLALRGNAVERFGLFSIRERLELLDGQFAINSAPGQGTRVTLRLPTPPPPPPTPTPTP